MKLRALIMATAGLGSMWLAACDFQGSFDKYCTYEGRCAKLDAGGPPRQISQSTQSRRVVVSGEYLTGATVQLLPAGVATPTGVVVEERQISMDVSLAPGVAENTLVMLEIDFGTSPRTDATRDVPLLSVTPIVVADGGNDDTGDGTYDNPYSTLERASRQSRSGDTIFVGYGSYGSIFPGTTPCDDTDGGLRAGVTVKGELTDAGGPVIAGGTTVGTCAFNLFSGDQVVQDLTIRGFPEGIRVTNTATDGGARPRVTGVMISSAGNGVVAVPGSSSLLERIEIRDSTAHGLVLDGADVTVSGGLVRNSALAGVVMIGSGGSLLLDGVAVESCGPEGTTDTLLGAGVVVASDAGLAIIDGGTINNNAITAVTVSGVDNTVQLSNADLQANFGDGIGLHVRDGSAAHVYLGNTTIRLSKTGIRVEDFRTFNAGTADGGWGGNTLANQGAGTEIRDARPSAGGARPAMTLSRTRIDGGIPGPSSYFAPGSTQWGIVIDNSGNEVRFE